MMRKAELAKIKEEAQGPDPKKAVTENLRKAIGKRIQQKRKASGLTALRISKGLDISREALTQIERGRNNVNATTLWKLASLLGCEPSELLPPVAKDYALTQADVAKVEKIDERAADWAKVLWPEQEQQKHEC